MKPFHLTHCHRKNRILKFLMLCLIHLFWEKTIHTSVVRALIYGPNSCFGCFGNDEVQRHDVTSYFEHARRRKMGDTTIVSCGQFAEFFFKPM